MITSEQYRQIQECKNCGLTMAETGRRLHIPASVVRNWWRKSEDDFYKAMRGTVYDLDNYRQYIIELIKACPTITNTNLMTQLREEFSDFEATYSTFNRYVKNLRVQAGLSQPKRIRCIRDDQPPGYEAQVDFGEYRMRNMYGKETKVYFFCMVLSYSRMKFVYFSPKPFTAKTAIEAHKYAFKYFGGRPQLIMYDQDKVFVVAESYGNVILVKEFDEFVKDVGYSLFICKGHDPNTKGRVENTVNVVKRGFLDGRTYYGIDRLNCDALNWLDTTGNSIVNDYTKRTPKELFPIENKALVKVRFQEKPIVQVLTMHAGFVEFRDNRYEMPQENLNDGERIRVELQEDTLLFYVALTSDLICKHALCNEVGRTIKLPKDRVPHHKIETDMLRFYKDNPLAIEFIAQLKIMRPRYIHKQLQLLKKASVFYTEGQMNSAFEYCINTCECTTLELLSFLIYKYGKDSFYDCTGNYAKSNYLKRSREIQEAFNGRDF